MLELLLFAVVLTVALAPLQRLGRMGDALGGQVARASFVLGGLVLASAIVAAVRAGDAVSPAEGVLLEPERSGHVSSNACRSCHLTQYASWHDSHHRSMTQLPSPQTIKAPWTGTLEWRGVRHRLFRRGDEFWVELPDPDRGPGGALAPRGVAARGPQGLAAPAAVSTVSRRVLMTTGSHHYQAYWVGGARGNELWQFPFVYHLATRRFIPRHDAFLQPEDDPVHNARWNSNCVQCHSVAGQPAHDLANDRFETRAAELGIACEACHGAGAEHVRRHQNPLRRYLAHTSEDADPSIVNPARLGAERSSEICGQCHSYFVPLNAAEWWDAGFSRSYRPGDALSTTRQVLELERDSERGLISADMASVFHPDGTIRVGGREWNGLSQSACFTRGRGSRQLSCLSCHDLHGGTRDDQLRAGMSADAPCAACHATHAEQASAHSHHPAGSSGSECVNCHMPFTTYALLKTIRSHRITRPNAGDTLDAGGPNACNLCHQDQSLEWTAEWLRTWYGSAPEAPSTTAATLSAAAVGLLSGDAAVRVIFADRLGWAAAQQASGRQFQAELLVEALDDPYSAVRFVADRSLRTLPGFEHYAYDFIAPRELRRRQQAAARGLLARAAPTTQGAVGPPALPLDATGRLPHGFAAELLARRDERPVRISE